MDGYSVYLKTCVRRTPNPQSYTVRTHRHLAIGGLGALWTLSMTLSGLPMPLLAS